MQRFLILFLTLALVAGVCADVEQMRPLPMPDGRIVGGTDADIRQFPHQISMRYNGRHRCGGSIYSSNIIVSASHCVINVEASRLTIVAGSSRLSENNVELPVVKYIMHEKYRSLNNDYDVALLVLGGQLRFNEFIQPIPLAKSRPALGTPLTVTGWGVLVEGGNIPDQLQKVDVNYVENTKCKSAYSIMLTSRMLCAGVEEGGKDACQGDSGGPLIVDGTLVGVVSWGTGCARKNYPGVYASVADLSDWIESTANKHKIEFAHMYFM